MAVDRGDPDEMLWELRGSRMNAWIGESVITTIKKVTRFPPAKCSRLSEHKHFPIGIFLLSYDPTNLDSSECQKKFYERRFDSRR
jgi:hypothetical protein